MSARKITKDASVNMRGTHMRIVSKGIGPAALNINTLIKMYNSADLPKALYGSEPWCNVSAKDLSKLHKAHIFCIKHIQGLRVSTSTDFSLVTVNSVPLETMVDYNKLKFFGQLCRLCPRLLVKDIFHNRLIRFNNFDQQSIGFIPDVCRIEQTYDLTDYIVTYIMSAAFPTKFQWKKVITENVVIRTQNNVFEGV